MIINNKETKKIKYIIATIFIVAIEAGLFLACEKDTYKSDALQNGKLVDTKNHKSMGNYQQPTQIIEIHTVMSVGEADYPISGNAVVGNYDERIYECNLTGVIHVVETDEVFSVHLTAVLKPEFEDIMIDVEPIMENYIITVNGMPFNQDFILIFPINTSFIEITYPDILNLWAEIVEICTTNTVIVYPFVLHESMLPYQYAVYEHNSSIAFDYILTTFNGFVGGEKEYFILSFNDADALLYYGLIAKSSIHFDSSVFVEAPVHSFIDMDDDTIDDEILHEASACKTKKYHTKNKEKFDRWVARKLKNGYVVYIGKKDDVWHAKATICNDWPN